jgi:nuclear pore complex protein Nup98-Nup96
MTDEDVPRKIVGLRIQREVPDLKESLTYRRQRLAVDAGLMMGRSFRVGWGPGWTLVHAGTACAAQEEGEHSMIYVTRFKMKACNFHIMLVLL